MRPADNIRKSFKELHVPTSAELDEKINREISRTLAGTRNRTSLLSQVNIWRIIMKSKTTKLVAAAIIVVALFLLFSKSQTTLYAQVVKALENARTIHVVSNAMIDGQWKKVVEIWYQKGIGEKRILWHRGKEDVRIDDGEHVWEYASGDDFAVQRKSTGHIQLPGEIRDVQRYLKACERDATGDKVIDGFSCELYIATRQDDTHRTRMMFWVDQQKRLRRFEEYVLQNGEWMADELGEVEYDTKLDPGIFTADFGVDIKVFEGDKILEEHFRLDKAIYVKEALGLIFAVHKVERCEGNMPYVVCSIRPTEETKRKVRSQGPAAWNYGSFHLGSSWKWVDVSARRDRCYQPVNLAQIYDAGLQVRWELLAPMGSWPEHVDECELEVQISATGKLNQLRTQSGLSCRERFKPITTLPLPNEETSLAQVLKEVHLVATMLEPFVGYDQLVLRSVPWTDEEMEAFVSKHPDSGEAKMYRSDKSWRIYHGRSSRPSEIKKEDWMIDRMEYIQECMNK
jgi:hypothetical protein